MQITLSYKKFYERFIHVIPIKNMFPEDHTR